MNFTSVDKANARPRGLRVGLTGGMGCGKSTAARMFRELGFGVLESDALVRELWETDTEVQQAVVTRWGSGILEEKGGGQGAENLALHTSPSTLHPSHFSISRRKIAEIVFANSPELDWLENLLHPRVRARWQATIAAEPARDWVVEIPLLFEKSLASGFDFALCIASSPALQAQRLAARGLSPAEISARQIRQWPLRDKIERADLVAFNDGSEDFLRRQIVHLAHWLRHHAKHQ
ncbi:MAG TPA: dephospho-CoA kinase [Opitutales bacterium]|jgi:dephospho-CoA kinase|nr:dephospho-CoA kinase [Opitutales bacterium]